MESGFAYVTLGQFLQFGNEKDSPFIFVPFKVTLEACE